MDIGGTEIIVLRMVMMMIVVVVVMMIMIVMVVIMVMIVVMIMPMVVVLLATLFAVLFSTLLVPDLTRTLFLVSLVLLVPLARATCWSKFRFFSFRKIFRQCT